MNVHVGRIIGNLQCQLFFRCFAKRNACTGAVIAAVVAHLIGRHLVFFQLGCLTVFMSCFHGHNNTGCSVVVGMFVAVRMGETDALQRQQQTKQQVSKCSRTHNTFNSTLWSID